MIGSPETDRVIGVNSDDGSKSLRGNCLKAFRKDCSIVSEHCLYQFGDPFFRPLLQKPCWYPLHVRT